MSTFKKLFGFSDNKLNKINTIKTIDKDQFVDETEPKVSYQRSEMKSDITPIKMLLEKNWHPSGYNDGYEFSNETRKKSRIKAIKAEIELAINKTIEMINENLSVLNQQIVSLGEDDDLYTQKLILESKREEYLEKINKLNVNMSLMHDCEGAYAKPIMDYRDGFVEGVSHKHQVSSISSLLNTDIL